MYVASRTRTCRTEWVLCMGCTRSPAPSCGPDVGRISTKIRPRTRSDRSRAPRPKPLLAFGRRRILGWVHRCGRAFIAAAWTATSGAIPCNADTRTRDAHGGGAGPVGSGQARCPTARKWRRRRCDSGSSPRSASSCHVISARRGAAIRPTRSLLPPSTEATACTPPECMAGSDKKRGIQAGALSVRNKASSTKTARGRWRRTRCRRGHSSW
jgi:hypothetical protein